MNDDLLYGDDFKPGMEFRFGSLTDRKSVV